MPSTADPVPCPACGAPLGGRAGCQETFDALNAAAWQDPARAAVHNLVVDIYAMQHPEEYGRSAKSYLQHLAALCCGVRHPGDFQLYWSIAPTFARTPATPKPPLLTERGGVTIADIATGPPADYAARVRAWAAAVWHAYGPQHGVARERLVLARRHRDASP